MKWLDKVNAWVQYGSKALHTISKAIAVISGEWPSLPHSGSPMVPGTEQSTTDNQKHP